MRALRGPRAALAALGLLATAACATTGEQAAPDRPPGSTATAPRARPGTPPPARAPEPMPEEFRSEDFIVTFAKPGDTPASLAAKYLGDAGKAWLIEDFNGSREFPPGREVIIPTGPWNPSGVESEGYQIVPILCYHNLAPTAKGRLVLAAKAFEEQMRYLKAEGYRVLPLREFVEWNHLKRQLPRRTVVLTFDDGYSAFMEHAYPVLKELGYTATLFVYTDYVGAGRNALSWADLKKLDAEGFDVQAHSKTHGDLRRAQGETDAQFARRMQTELADPLALFRRNLGKAPPFLAFPYGRSDEGVEKKAREVGYTAAFTVRRQGSPAFVAPLRVNRSQVYSEMTLEDFIKNLNVFQSEDLR